MRSRLCKLRRYDGGVLRGLAYKLRLAKVVTACIYSWTDTAMTGLGAWTEYEYLQLRLVAGP